MCVCLCLAGETSRWDPLDTKEDRVCVVYAIVNMLHSNCRNLWSDSQCLRDDPKGETRKHSHNLKNTDGKHLWFPLPDILITGRKTAESVSQKKNNSSVLQRACLRLCHAVLCGTDPHRPGRVQPWMLPCAQRAENRFRITDSYSLSAADCTPFSHFYVLALHIFWKLPVLKAFSVHICPAPAQRWAGSKLNKCWLSWSEHFFLSSEQILLEYLRKHNNTLVVSRGNGPTSTGKRQSRDLAGLPGMPNTWSYTEWLTFIKCHSKTKLGWHSERRYSFQYICLTVLLPSKMALCSKW